MVTRSSAAPPTPWSMALAEPQVHPTAYIHPFSQVIGDVRIGQGVLIAPGSSVRADEGAPFYIGDGCNIQDGVVIHGLAHGRVLGTDQQPYSVWIGPHSSITHKTLIHGPAYIGEDCFIGFRSTIFNARLGKGCVVMMHALVQDVEVAPGKFVPSGVAITNQAQADRLPDVQPEERAFAQEVLGVNEALRSGYLCSEDTACITPIRQSLSRHSANANAFKTVAFRPDFVVDPSAIHHSAVDPFAIDHATQQVGRETMQSHRLSPEVIQQVRQFLSQGYRIGSEYADQRRYRSGVWQSCSPVQSTREADAIAAIEACMAEHADSYVRIFGIEPINKQRVGMITVQRADGKAVENSPRVAAAPAARTANAAAGYGQAGYGQASYGSAGNSNLSPDLVQQVRNLLQQGYRIGTEHATGQRYRSGVWQTCTPIQNAHESEVLSALQSCLTEHAGEYVRMFGIDPVGKRRVSTTTIQRGDGKAADFPVANVTNAGTTPNSGGTANATVSHDLANQVRSILSPGAKLGIEYADQRRYRSGIWQTAPAISAGSESAVLGALSQFLADHAQDYVRIFGINPQAKQRSQAITIQRPGSSPEGRSAQATPGYGQSPAASQGGGNQSSNGKGASNPALGADLAQQVVQLINQGYRVSTEYADQRRYRSGAWQTGAAIQAARPAEVVAALEAQLANHQGHYVRLVGVDPKAKRRVLETTIQRP